MDTKKMNKENRLIWQDLTRKDVIDGFNLGTSEGRAGALRAGKITQSQFRGLAEQGAGGSFARGVETTPTLSSQQKAIAAGTATGTKTIGGIATRTAQRYGLDDPKIGEKGVGVSKEARERVERMGGGEQFITTPQDIMGASRPKTTAGGELRDITPEEEKMATTQKTEPIAETTTMEKALQDAEDRAAKAKQEAEDAKKALDETVKGAQKAFEGAAERQKEQYEQLKTSMGEQFAQLENAIDRVESESGAAVQIDDQLSSQAQNIINTVQDPEERSKALDRLVSSNLVSVQAIKPTTPQEKAETQQQAADKIPAQTVTQQNANVTAGNSIGTQAQTIKAVEQSKPNLKSYSFDSLIDILSDPNSTYADIAKAGIALKFKDTEEKDKIIVDSFDRLNSYYDNVKLETQNQQSIFSAQLNKIAEENKDIIGRDLTQVNEKFNLERSRLEEGRSRNITELTDQRNKMEAFAKAQLAFSGMLDSGYGINKVVSTVRKYDDMISDVQKDYDFQLQDLHFQQQSIVFDYTDKVVAINQQLGNDLIQLNSETQNKLLAIDENKVLLAIDKDKERSNINAEFRNSIAAITENARNAEMQERAAAINELRKRAEDISSFTGIMYTVENNEVVPMLDQNGKPILSWERTKTNMEEMGKLISTPEKDENLNAWQINQNFALKQKLDSGAISQSVYNDALAGVQMIVDEQNRQWYNDQFDVEGFRSGLLSGFSQNKINKMWTEGTTNTIKGNCVFYAREAIPTLPTGLFNLDDKVNIINSNVPNAGSVAIIDVGDSTGHVAVVESVNEDGTMTISESNFRSDENKNPVLSRRTGTAEQLGVLGFWQPQAQPTATNDQIQDLVNSANSPSELNTLINNITAGLPDDQANRISREATLSFTKKGKGFGLSAIDELEAKALSTEIFGKKAGSESENINLIKKLKADGLSSDDIKDTLRQRGFGKEFSGTIKSAFNNISIKGFTAEQKESNRNALEELVSEFGQNSNEVKEFILGMANASSGTTEQQQVGGRVDAVNNLRILSDQLDDYINSGGDTNLLSGKIEEFTENVLKATGDSELARIANEIQVAIIDYRRSVSGAAFTESEANQYEQIFPSIGNTPELNKQKITSLLNVFNRNANNFYRRQVGSSNYEKLFPNGAVPVILGENKINFESDQELWDSL